MTIRSVWKGLLLSIMLAMPASAWAESLVDTLVSQLGVTQQQASGGAGALLGFAQQSMETSDWSQLVSLVPEASNLAAAANLGGTSNTGILGSIMGLFGGGNKAGPSMADVVQSFAGLNLDPTTIAQFTPILLQYIQSQGGGELVQTLSGLWSSGFTG